MLGEDGEFRPKAFLILFGHMLFPDNRSSAEQFSLVADVELKIGLGQIDREGPVPTDAPLPQQSFALTALVREAKARAGQGIDAGAVARCHMQISERWPDASINKALWLSSMRWAEESDAGRAFAALQIKKNKGRKDPTEHYRERVRKLYRTYWPVAHFWAAWCELSPQERDSLHHQPDELAMFLRLSSFFEHRLRAIAEAGPKQMRRLPSALLGVPKRFNFPIVVAISDELRPQDIAWLNSYESDATGEH